MVTSEMAIFSTQGKKAPKKPKNKISGAHISLLCTLIQENFLNHVGFGKEKTPFL